MNRLPAQQRGASGIVTLIILLLLGYAVYIGIQYMPIMIESKSIDTMLSNVQDAHKTDPINSVEEARSKVINMLQMNEMNDMTENVKVKQSNGGITIEINYDRGLNLVYKKTALHYGKSLRLN